MSGRNGKAPSYRNVTQSRPCPICHKSDQCSVSDDGDWCVCYRRDRADDGTAGTEKTARDGRTYWRYRMTPWPENRSGKVHEPKVEMAGDGATAADADTLHAVYAALVAESPYPPQSALEERGFRWPHPVTIGYRHLGRSRIFNVSALIDRKLEEHFPAVPGFYIREPDEKIKTRCWSLAGRNGLLIPVRDEQGRIVGMIIRADELDGGGGRYRYLSSAGRKGGPGPGAPIHFPVFSGDRSVCRVTEGALKADLATHLSGVYTIGLPGVGSWRRAASAVKAVGATTVKVAFDADACKNPRVADALHGLAESLLKRPGLTVELERWDVADGKGIDDLLAAGKQPDVIRGEEAVRWAVAGLVAEARKAAPTEATGDGPRQPDQFGRPEVEVTADEYQVVTAVTAALAADDQLFQRQGVPVRPLVLNEGEAPQLTGRAVRAVRPAGLTVLRPAEPAFVRLRVTRACRLTVITEDGPKQVHPPAWLAPAVLACPGAIRAVEGVLPGPTLDAGGRLISAPGYDEATRWYLGRDLPGLALPDRPAREDAVASAALLGGLVGDFPWHEEADKSRWLCLLLTAVCRHLIDRTPMGLITANVAGSGKTYLARLVSIIAHGLRTPILMSWPEGSELMSRGDEVRKRLASLLHESASLVMLDNLPRGGDFGSPEIDAFITADAYHDRQLGKNDGSRVGGPNRCLLLATGNQVMPCGDTADRTLVVRLRSPHPNPRALPPETYHVPDLERHALDERPRYLGAALTIWRAWLLAGQPRPAGDSWGTFEVWAGSVVAAVRWLGWPDPLADRVRQMGETDRESQALASLLSHWREALGRETLGCGEIIRRLDGEAASQGVLAMRESLAQLGAGSRWPPSLQRVGKTLAAYRDRVVCIDEQRRARLCGELDAKAKAWRYHVEDDPRRVVAGIAGIDPNHLAGGEGASDGQEVLSAHVEQYGVIPAIPANTRREGPTETYIV